MVNEREIALSILVDADKSQKYMNLTKDVLDRYDYLLPRQKSFIKRIVDGTIERRITLDYIIDSYASVKVKKQKTLIRNILRMTVYQIYYMNSVPDSAAINEAVKLTAKKKFTNLKGFVNGTLRNISRNKEEFDFPKIDEKDKNVTENMSVVYSMPKDLCDEFVKNFGVKKSCEIFEFFLQARPVTIRFDEKMTQSETENLIDEMKAYCGEDFEIKKHDFFDKAYELFHTDNIRYIPGFDEGKWTVQDVSSMLVTYLSGIKKGDIVLDVCSAPGGKALHAASVLSKYDEKGLVYSRDVSDKKVMLIEENADRLGLSDRIIVSKMDATVHDAKSEDMCDILFCDLPCSGLGIIGRKVDIKYTHDLESLDEINKLQKKIIDSVWNYVKIGGTLMYSTCTLNKKENEDMLTYICENYPFERVSIEKDMPDKIKEESAKDGYITLIPGKYDTDGFFIGKLKRIG